jgi:hypothetical protein
MRHSEPDSIQISPKSTVATSKKRGMKTHRSPGEVWIRARGDDIHTVLKGALG